MGYKIYIALIIDVSATVRRGTISKTFARQTRSFAHFRHLTTLRAFLASKKKEEQVSDDYVVEPCTEEKMMYSIVQPYTWLKRVL